MNRSKLTAKDILAVVIALAALTGVAMMFVSEPNTLQTTGMSYQKDILPHLKDYSLALGALLVAVSVAYILLGRENDVDTTSRDQD